MGVLYLEGGAMEYTGAEYHCWRCGRLTTVYTWAGHEMWGKAAPPPGKPASIKWIYSRTAEGSYWANTCLHCGVVIGDWYLYDEPGAPFAVPYTDQLN